jgi:hypothetical protein
MERLDLADGLLFGAEGWPVVTHADHIDEWQHESGGTIGAYAINAVADAGQRL